MTGKRVLIIIPAYNEEKSIGKLVGNVKRHLPAADILVVNDGSSDFTGQVASEKGALVIDLPINLGIGAAMQAGYMFAKEAGYDIAVQCDGDGQHPPYQIKNIIAPLIEGKADIVVGSRFLKKVSYRSSFARQVGIVMFSKIVTFLTKAKLTDTTCGFRALGHKAISYFATEYPYDYPEVEALILAHKKRLKVIEVPIRIYRRKHGLSSISFIDSFHYTFKVLLAILISYSKPSAPKKEEMHV